MRLTFMRGALAFGCALMAMGAGPGQGMASSFTKPRPGMVENNFKPAPVKPERPGSGTDGALSSYPTGELTLGQALALALMKNPELAGVSWNVRIAEAKKLQAGLLPNPELSADTQQYAGGGPHIGFHAAQSNFLLSQRIELGGKRGKRTCVAALDKELTGWTYEAKKFDVLTETAKAFIDVVAAQEQVALATDLVQLSEKVLYSVSERVKAGKVSPLEETRSSVELSNTRIELARAQSSLQGARKRLSNSWGQAEPGFEKAEGALDNVRPIPPPGQLANFISQNPDVARWAKEMEQRKAVLKLEEAKRIPDLTLTGGVQRFEDTNAEGAYVGFSVPLPIFDRNQGGIQEARYGIAKAEADSRAAVAKANADLAVAYQELSASYKAALSLKNDLLPAAERAFEASREGYREGKFGFLEVLDSQRTLFQARARYIEVLAAYHKSAADIERLTGERLETAGHAPAR
jgi:outer membrane protein, heavy metal efflux system